MNNFFVVVVAVLVVLSGTLLFFYRRDVLDTEGSNGDISGCVPFDLQVQDVSALGFVVEWETEENCLGFVKYGDSVDAINLIAFDENGDIAVKKHAIKISDLKASSIYYVMVISEGTEYGLEGTPIIVSTKAF